MTAYQAPIRDMIFAMKEIGGLARIAALPGNEEVSDDLIEAIFEEARKFAGDVLAPLNHPGDKQGCVCKDGVVTTPDGVKEAYRRLLRERLARHARLARTWRPGPAGPRLHAGAGNVDGGESGFFAVPDADARRHCRHRPSRLGRPEGALSAEHGRRDLDRHDEPDRASGRLRSRRRFALGQSVGTANFTVSSGADFHHLGRQRRSR